MDTETNINEQNTTDIAPESETAETSQVSEQHAEESSQETANEQEQQSNEINWGQLREKYRNEGKNQALRELQEQYAQQQTPQQQYQDSNVAQQQQAPQISADEIYNRIKNEEAAKRVANVGNMGKQEYKDWDSVAAFYEAEAMRDPQIDQLVRESASMVNGHKILHSIFKDRQAFENLKRVRPEYLATELNRYASKATAPKVLPNEPLSEVNSGTSANTNTEKSYTQKYKEKLRQIRGR